VEPWGSGVSPENTYDEMSTARLTWVVLDRLVPPDDEATARAALIARDPELATRVATGMLSEDEAIEILRRRQGVIRDPARRSVAPVVAIMVAVLLLAWLVLNLAR
jgi:hypothetical protein